MVDVLVVALEMAEVQEAVVELAAAECLILCARIYNRH